MTYEEVYMMISMKIQRITEQNKRLQLLFEREKPKTANKYLLQREMSTNNFKMIVLYELLDEIDQAELIHKRKGEK